MVGTIHRARVLFKREETVSVGMRLRLEFQKKNPHGVRGQILSQLKSFLL